MFELSSKDFLLHFLMLRECCEYCGKCTEMLAEQLS